MKQKPLLLLSGLGLASLTWVFSCKSGSSSKESEALVNRSAFFNDNLPEGYDSFTWDKKVETLWNMNVNSPPHVMPDPSPNSTDPVLGATGELPNFRKVIPFISDSLDFANRTLKGIAELNIYTRMRDVYPRYVEDEKGRRAPHRRATHPVGTVGVIKFKPTEDTPYTGMFKTGATGLARLSTATNPFITDVMNRAAVIKFPVTNSYSRSWFAMNRIVAQKIGVGQDVKKALMGDPANKDDVDWRYFKQGKILSNILPPAQGFETGLVQKFADVTKYILETTGKWEEGKYDPVAMASWLSVENVSWNNQDGSRVANPKAPHRVTLIPNPALYAAGPTFKKVDFRRELEKLPKGTLLWTVYGTDSTANPFRDIDKPDPWNVPDAQLDKSQFGVKIGEIYLEEQFKTTVFANEGIMYKHFVADMEDRDKLDRDFANLGEQPLKKPEEVVYDVIPANFMSNPADKVVDCAAVAKTKFEDNARKRGAFAEYLDRFDFLTSDVAPYCMNRMNTAAGFPEQLQGVWWMNGNPAAETLVAFGKTGWDNEKKEITVYPQVPGTWAWYASSATRDEDDSARFKKTTEELAGMKNYESWYNQFLKFKFDPSNPPDEWRIKNYTWEDPDRRWGPSSIAFPTFVYDISFLTPKKAAGERNPESNSYGVPTIEDPNTPSIDTLLQRTKIAGGLVHAEYKFTRILDGKGKPTANYQIYLDAMRRHRLAFAAIRNATKDPKQKVDPAF